ncbi:MAG: hypothetical protein HKN70_14960 [Gammaproteobacteria bacterium]|nr:hypothetical protein [Gammaproteobacteria bacterium]
MAIAKYDVQPLFAVPFFRADLSHAITDAQVDYIKNLKMVTNRDNLISENLYIFEEPELASIKAAVQEALDLYATEVMGIDQSLYVTQSWSLINHPGIGMHTHSHSNSVVSGSLYYCELPDPPSNMVFDKSITYQQLVMNPKVGKQNIFNTPINVVTPKQNEIFLFSSSLQHAVEANAASVPRYSVAFNCFIKGQLGDYRDVSHL